MKQTSEVTCISFLNRFQSCKAMINVVYSPRWFYGKDIIIDLIGILILALIAYFSLQYYKLDKKNKNYLYLTFSFSLIALSFLFKIVTNFTIYYHVFETEQIGPFTLTYQSLASSNTLFFVGFFLYRLLTLYGLYTLYILYQKQSKTHLIIGLYLIAVVTYFSESAYYIFHLTALIILFLITSQFFKNYRMNKYYATRLLAFSFGIIMFSHIFSMFIVVNKISYVISECIQLLGYVLLLLTFITVLKNAKKKK